MARAGSLIHLGTARRERVDMLRGVGVDNRGKGWTALGVIAMVLVGALEAAYPVVLPQALHELREPRLYGLSFVSFEGAYAISVLFAGQNA